MYGWEIVWPRPMGSGGLLALFVPVVVGGWSDSLRTRLGRRMPFILTGAAIIVAALVLMPLGAGSLLLAGLAVEVMRDVGALTFDDTRGYSAIFAVTAALLVDGTPALRRIGVPSTARP